jgi:hypothetical protein
MDESEQNEKEAAAIKRELLKRIRMGRRALVGTGPDYPPREGWDGFHWEITLHFEQRQMTTLYSMGRSYSYIAVHRTEVADVRVEDAGFSDHTSLFAKAPKIPEVLYSLQSDASVPDSFDHFCEEFGYDTDSRKAEKIHQACLQTHKNLHTLFQGSFDDFLNTNWDE